MLLREDQWVRVETLLQGNASKRGNLHDAHLATFATHPGSQAHDQPERRDRFLADIEAVTPWTDLVTELKPFYLKEEGRGRPPIGLARMLRMYIVQQCFGLSDEGMEDAVYDSQANSPEQTPACSNETQ